MPKRTDIKSILIIGAGPIVIGQACEFDYSGAQACKALKEEGYRVVLVNSNPATIMTDPETADSIYIEPVNWRTVERELRGMDTASMHSLAALPAGDYPPDLVAAFQELRDEVRRLAALWTTAQECSPANIAAREERRAG